MTKAPPHRYTVPTAVVDGTTEMALKAEQNAQHERTGKRPTMPEVVAGILVEWGKSRSKPA